MEIAYVGSESIRIKGKQITLLTNPKEGKNKTIADATLMVGQEKTDVYFSETTGIVFQGSGEYEIKGTKITGFTKGGGVMFTVHIDGISLFLGTVTAALAAKDTLHEHDVAVLFTDGVLSQAVMGVLNASMLLFVGEQNAENAKAFDKEMQPVSKYVTTKDKLPAEPEFVFLG